MPSKKKALQQKRKWPWLKEHLFPIAIPRVLGCIAYANSTGVPFFFDDLDSFQRNRDVRFGTYSYFSPSVYFQTRSLLYATFAFNDWLGGQKVWGYHIVNLLLHILNGLLVFTVGVKVLRKVVTDPETVRKYALLAAAFFVVHTIQTESVTYISSRSELLSTFFYLLGFLFFAVMPENRIGFLTSLLVSVFLALGFGAKETVVTLPATIFLYDYLFIAKTKF